MRNARTYSWAQCTDARQIHAIRKNEIVAEPFTVTEDMVANAMLSSVSAYATQKWAPEDLSVLSQPPGAIPISQFKNYVYRFDGIRGLDGISPSYIYHAELGISPHLDFYTRPVE